MQWWDSLVAWFDTDAGRLVLLGGAVPFVAILVSGLLAAWIARGSVRRVLARRDREARAAVIALLADAAGQAAVWSSSSPGERVLIDRAVAEADLALRLLTVRGARLAADWAAHEIAGLKRASAVYSLELDLPLAEFRDRLVDWHRRPRRARRLFEADLIRWRTESDEDRRADRDEMAPSAARPAAPAPSEPEQAAGGAHPKRPSAPWLETSRERDEPGQVEAPTDEEFAGARVASGAGTPGA